MHDDGEKRKFGECPWCKQTKWLEFYIGQAKGTGRIVSGHACNDCLKKAQGEEEKKDG